MNVFIIRDWAGNLMFSGQSWNSWDDAEAFLTEFLGDAYETDRGEYYIQEPDDAETYQQVRE